MARPKTITDQRLLDAAHEVIARVGPGFTLAQVAAEAGVSVGTVGGRFGSKAGLLRALFAHATAVVAVGMRTAAEAEDDPVAGLRAAATVTFVSLGDAESAANHLSQLGFDLIDPHLRAMLGTHFEVMQDELRRAFRRAAPLLPGAPGEDLASRVLLSLVNGISIDWSIRPHGRLVDRLSDDVDAVLTAWGRR
ncbi:helix-turn-helix domain-containing protein [Actinokineospora sp. NBRC 105648]|uniref:TetR/AcrR family transcriptional regulator n=1 Tax=Actinokineospora sp. NBRC 105648 TaxID=3032206 RepID=UPI0024A5F3D3|nr:helix-turn-helix domain-containing protein [Actinokineospora sp. NBRC 105648]GLZ37461.1 TetR family transcriptional regulator [Actinokineospora sp. NBRC 105648]